ncbi:MAG: DUF4199 domain-containing protein [Bacteroidota bacterium]
METKSPWPMAMKYGLIVAFAHIIVNIVFYMINPELSQKGTSALGITQLLILLAATIYILYSVTVKRRDEDLDGYISYSQSLGFMIKIALPASFVIAIYTYIFLAYINVDFMQKMWETQAQEMYNQGKSEEEVEQVMKVGKMMSSPLILTFFGFMGSLFQLFIFSLIASIFARKQSPIDTIQ